MINVVCRHFELLENAVLIPLLLAQQLLEVVLQRSYHVTQLSITEL